ncbi:MAG: hypothetical protein JWM11_7553 [Planctomycetaceae bacterium]|nr:hypothetical protein [Planctomycetaceae bacterium]
MTNSPRFNNMCITPAQRVPGRAAASCGYRFLKRFGRSFGVRRRSLSMPPADAELKLSLPTNPKALGRYV